MDESIVAAEPEVRDSENRIRFSLARSFGSLARISGSARFSRSGSPPALSRTGNHVPRLRLQPKLCHNSFSFRREFGRYT
jgi:hypothetical protein